MRNDFESNYLMHHGIQGQKWGVKNGPPYPLDSNQKSSFEKKEGKGLSDKQKKILKGIAITAGVIGVGAAAYYVVRKNSIKGIAKQIPQLGKSGKAIEAAAKDIINNELKETDIVLKKGTELYKAHVEKDFDVSKVDDIIYSSHNQLDRIAYRYGLFNWKKNKERYEAIFKATQDLRGPNEETAREIFEKLYNSNKEYRDSLLDSVAQGYVKAYRTRGGFNNLTDQQLFEKALRYAEEDLEKNLFRTGMGNMVSNTSTSKMLVNEFKKNGYDFVEDYMDKNHFAKEPIVLLDNSKIKQEGVKWFNYYNKANRQLAKNILIKNKHGGAFGWSVEDP